MWDEKDEISVIIVGILIISFVFAFSVPYQEATTEEATEIQIDNQVNGEDYANGYFTVITSRP